MGYDIMPGSCCRKIKISWNCSLHWGLFVIAPMCLTTLPEDSNFSSFWLIRSSLESVMVLWSISNSFQINMCQYIYIYTHKISTISNFAAQYRFPNLSLQKSTNRGKYSVSKQSQFIVWKHSRPLSPHRWFVHKWCIYNRLMAPQSNFRWYW